MRRQSADRAAKIALSLLAAVALADCAAPGPEALTDQPGATRPPTISADQLVGKWGIASYHQESARQRAETAAKSGCNQPYTIVKGSTGGVVMHMADNSVPQELQLKGGTTGKNYVGPAGQLTTDDREVVIVDAKMMTLRWLDPEIVGRYGTMVYSRCEDHPAPPKPKSKSQKKN